MRKTFKYRIYPTKSQLTSIENILELTRWVYNETLALRKKAWETEKKSISLYESQKELTKWKQEKPELKNVYTQALQQAQVRVDFAFKSFFRRCKKEEKPGYPRFKGPGRYKSITFPQNQFGFRLYPTESKVYLSKIGDVKIVLHRPIQGVIKTCTIKREPSGKWFITFSCDKVEKPEPLPQTGKIVGIDLGLMTYVQCSDGTKIDKPRFFKKEQKELTRIQNKVQSKKTKHTEALIHERIKNKREDFCHKTANKLVKKYDFIAHEDLDTKNMLEQKKYSKSIADAAWATLVEFITFKAENAGRYRNGVNPRGTSQRCSQCGAEVSKDITVRVHNCPQCGYKAPRDLNSALEVLRLGMQSAEYRAYVATRQGPG